MNIDLLVLLKSYVTPIILGAGGAAAIVKYLGKKIVDQTLARSLENFKADLARETEALKSYLDVHAHSKKEGITLLNQAKAEAIKSIYNRVCDADQELRKILFEFELKSEITLDDVNDFSTELRRVNFTLDDCISLSQRSWIYFNEGVNIIAEDEIYALKNALAMGFFNVSEFGLETAKFSNEVKKRAKKIRHDHFIPLKVKLANRFNSAMTNDIKEISNN